jgi:hypothetical protein
MYEHCVPLILTFSLKLKLKIFEHYELNSGGGNSLALKLFEDEQGTISRIMVPLKKKLLEFVCGS